MINVYWSKYNIFTNELNPSMSFEPSNILLDYSKNIGKPIRDDVNWIGCPAVKNLLKNTFSFKNPMTLDLSFNKDKTIDWNAANLEDYISVREYSENNLIMDYLVPLSLFSEDDISIDVIDPFFNKNKIGNAHFIPGQFNISKWFRPVVPSYAIYDNIRFKINENEDLFYIKFNTDKKINFIEFYFTDTLRDVVKSSLEIKRYKKNTPLSNLYKKFDSNRINKIVMKEIRKSRI